MVAGQDGCTALGNVFDAFLDRLENLANSRSENNVLQHPVDAAAASMTQIGCSLGRCIDRDEPTAHAGTVLSASSSGGRPGGAAFLGRLGALRPSPGRLATFASNALPSLIAALTDDAYAST